MKSGLFHTIVFFAAFPFALKAQGNQLNYQLYDSLICRGDSAFMSVSGCSGVSIWPSSSVLWLDSAHALLYPDTSTRFLLTGTSFSHQNDTSYFTISVSIPHINIAAGTILCHGGQATINVSGSGGIPPYSGTGIYSVVAGTHYFNITDDAGCNSGDSVEIEQPSALTPNEAVGSIPCFGDSAAVTITATGGTPPYIGTGTYFALAGTHRFMVTDSNRCSTSLSVSITQPSQLSMQILANPIHCYGDSALVTVTAFGGTPQYTGTGNFNEAPGTRYFTVTDLAGCRTEDSVTITQPAPLAINIQADTNGVCANVIVTICATAGFESYFWNSGDTGICIHPNQGGDYYVTVTDGNNCRAESNHIPLVVRPSPNVSVNIHGDTLTAYEGASYQWFANEEPIPGATSYRYIGRIGEEYQVQVTDSDGCTAISNPLGIIGAILSTAAKRIRIYPNPLAADGFRLSVNEDFLGAVLDVFNEEGRLVYSQRVTEVDSRIDFNMPAGIYLLKITGMNGSTEQKLVKL